MLHWAIFLLLISFFIAIDLGVFQKGKNRNPDFKSAMRMTLCWSLLAILFAVFIFFDQNKKNSIDFLTAYLVELSLSVDNVFVFILIFQFFQVNSAQQHRILFWGVVGAIVMRFIMITVGVYLVHHLQWIFYVFGAILIYSGIKIVSSNKDEKHDFEKSKFLRIISRLFGISSKTEGEKFIIIENGKKVFSRLFLVLLLIEQTDLVFAIDSVPAVLAISQDYFIVFTSNVFAILGLRSMYFLLSGTLDKFHYLKYGLAAILLYIGSKMIMSVQGIHINTLISLTVIITCLFGAILASMIKKR